jgi:hypothetical protein
MHSDFTSRILEQDDWHERMFGLTESNATGKPNSSAPNSTGLGVVKVNFSSFENFTIWDIYNESDSKNKTDSKKNEEIMKEFLRTITRSFFVGEWSSFNNTKVSSC